MHPKDNRRRILLGLVAVSLFTLVLQSIGTFRALRYSGERKASAGEDHRYCKCAAFNFTENLPS